MKPAELELAMN